MNFPSFLQSSANRRTIASAIVLCCGLACLQSADAQSRELPFRAKKDGSVNYEDLLKLTRQGAARDSITDEELAAIKDKHKVKYNDLFKPTGETIDPPRKDLYASSLILSDGVNHTLLPKRAIVFLPEKYQRRVVEEPIGKLVFWPEFQQINRTWIKPLEVTLDVAKGDQPIEESVREKFESGFYVVVSVYRNSPISLMPLKEAPALAEDGKEKISANGGAARRTRAAPRS